MAAEDIKMISTENEALAALSPGRLNEFQRLD